MVIELEDFIERAIKQRVNTVLANAKVMSITTLAAPETQEYMEFDVRTKSYFKTTDVTEETWRVCLDSEGEAYIISKDGESLATNIRIL